MLVKKNFDFKCDAENFADSWENRGYKVMMYFDRYFEVWIVAVSQQQEGEVI